MMTSGSKSKRCRDDVARFFQLVYASTPQLVFDTSFLLALRPDDDKPHAVATQAFARRLRPCIAALESVAWLVMPVIQECYHIILTGVMRRAWQNQDPTTRPAGKPVKGSVVLDPKGWVWRTRRTLTTCASHPHWM